VQASGGRSSGSEVAAMRGWVAAWRGVGSARVAPGGATRGTGGYWFFIFFVDEFCDFVDEFMRRICEVNLLMNLEELG
jgi:hypothetical protein